MNGKSFGYQMNRGNEVLITTARDGREITIIFDNSGSFDTCGYYGRGVTLMADLEEIGTSSTREVVKAFEAIRDKLTGRQQNEKPPEDNSGLQIW